MKVTKIYCDICGRRTDVGGWETSSTPLKLTVYVSSQNPLGKITGSYQTSTVEYNDVCDGCRRAVAKAILDTLEERMKLRLSGLVEENEIKKDIRK